MIALILALAVLAAFRGVLAFSGLFMGPDARVSVKSHPIWSLLHNASLLYVLYALSPGIAR